MDPRLSDGRYTDASGYNQYEAQQEDFNRSEMKKGAPVYQEWNPSSMSSVNKNFRNNNGAPDVIGAPPAPMNIGMVPMPMGMMPPGMMYAVPGMGIGMGMDIGGPLGMMMPIHGMQGMGMQGMGPLPAVNPYYPMTFQQQQHQPSAGHTHKGQVGALPPPLSGAPPLSFKTSPGKGTRTLIRNSAGPLHETAWLSIVNKFAPFTVEGRAGAGKGRAGQVHVIFDRIELSPVPPPTDARRALKSDSCFLCLHGQPAPLSPIVTLTCAQAGQGCLHGVHMECLSMAFWAHKPGPAHPPLDTFIRARPVSPRALAAALRAAGDGGAAAPVGMANAARALGRCTLELCATHLLSDAVLLTAKSVGLEAVPVSATALLPGFGTSNILLRFAISDPTAPRHRQGPGLSAVFIAGNGMDGKGEEDGDGEGMAGGLPLPVTRGRLSFSLYSHALGLTVTGAVPFDLSGDDALGHALTDALCGAEAHGAGTPYFLLPVGGPGLPACLTLVLAPCLSAAGEEGGLPSPTVASVLKGTLGGGEGAGSRSIDQFVVVGALCDLDTSALPLPVSGAPPPSPRGMGKSSQSAGGGGDDGPLPLPPVGGYRPGMGSGSAPGAPPLPPPTLHTGAREEAGVGGYDRGNAAPYTPPYGSDRSYQDIQGPPGGPSNQGAGGAREGRGGYGGRDKDGQGGAHASGAMSPRVRGLYNLAGRMAETAKTQTGSKFLQQQLMSCEPGSGGDVPAFILDRCEWDLPDLAQDLFGNYFLQALFRAGDGPQRERILRSLAPALVDIACDRNGTYALQSMVDLVAAESPSEVAALRAGLERDPLRLITHSYGSHVILRFLKRVAPSQADFIHTCVLGDVGRLVTHPHAGAVVLLTIDTAERSVRAALLAYIIRNTVVLSQHPFGSYAVAHLMGRRNRTLRVGSFPGLAEVLSNACVTSPAAADTGGGEAGDNGYGGLRPSMQLPEAAFPMGYPVLGVRPGFIAHGGFACTPGTEAAGLAAAAAAAGAEGACKGDILPGPHPLFDLSVADIRGMWLSAAVCCCLRGRFVQLARGKFSCAVIEKAATYGAAERTHVLHELFVTGRLVQEGEETSVVQEEGAHLADLLADANAAYVIQTALQSLHPKERRRVVLLVQPYLHVFAKPGVPPAVHAKWLTLCSRLLASACTEEESSKDALGALPAADPESWGPGGGEGEAGIRLLPNSLEEGGGAGGVGFNLDYSYSTDGQGGGSADVAGESGQSGSGGAGWGGGGSGSRFAFARNESDSGSRWDSGGGSPSSASGGGTGGYVSRPRLPQGQGGYSGQGSGSPYAQSQGYRHTHGRDSHGWDRDREFGGGSWPTSYARGPASPHSPHQPPLPPGPGPGQTTRAGYGGYKGFNGGHSE